MVSVSVFAVIMVMMGGSIASVFDGNKKSQSLRTVMDNLNITMESMTRSIRFGTNYHCGTTGDTSTPLDCAGGDTSLTVRDLSGVIVTYSISNGHVTKRVGVTTQDLTSSDVTITRLTFFVSGSEPYINTSPPVGCLPSSQCKQSKIVMVVSGYAGVKPTTQSSFTLQTSVSQRTFDFRQI
ncbi:MAG: hypothetical protein WAX37_01130 [Minisyncoccia bacterium]